MAGRRRQTASITMLRNCSCHAIGTCVATTATASSRRLVSSPFLLLLLAFATVLPVQVRRLHRPYPGPRPAFSITGPSSQMCPVDPLLLRARCVGCDCRCCRKCVEGEGSCRLGWTVGKMQREGEGGGWMCGRSASRRRQRAAWKDKLSAAGTEPHRAFTALARTHSALAASCSPSSSSALFATTSYSSSLCPSTKPQRRRWSHLIMR